MAGECTCLIWMYIYIYLYKLHGLVWRYAEGAWSLTVVCEMFSLSANGSQSENVPRVMWNSRNKCERKGADVHHKPRGCLKQKRIGKLLHVERSKFYKVQLCMHAMWCVGLCDINLPINKYLSNNHEAPDNVWVSVIQCVYRVCTWVCMQCWQPWRFIIDISQNVANFCNNRHASGFCQCLSQDIIDSCP